MKDMKVDIGGMSCGSCVKRVSKAFEKVEGVMKCDVEIGSAKVTYDETKIDINKLLDVVRMTGYSIKGELG